MKVETIQTVFTPYKIVIEEEVEHRALLMVLAATKEHQLRYTANECSIVNQLAELIIKRR